MPVIGHLLGMLTAIELDDQLGLKANEIADIRAERPLAAKAKSVELPSS